MLIEPPATWWQRPLNGPAVVGTVLLERQRAAAAGFDPLEVAREQNWVEAYAPGRWVMSGALLGLQHALCRQAATIATSLAFEPVQFPRLLTHGTAEKMGLTRVFDRTLMRVTGGRGLDGWLDPVQCGVFYDLISARRQRGLPAPRRVFEDAGPTFRDEPADRLGGLDTCCEFRRCEFAWQGPPDEVVAVRQRVVLALSGLLETLGLSYRWVVGRGCADRDLCGAEHPAPPGLALRQATTPVIDLECPLADGRWLEVAGGTLHFEFKLRQWGLADGAWSSCFGLGITRLCCAALARHGTAVARLLHALA